MIDDERLERIRRDVDHWEARRQRAAERLAAVKGNCWYFAVLGMRTQVEGFIFHETIRFQKVIEPPGEVELASALKENILFGAIGRYSHSIEFELAIDRDFGTDQACFNLSWHLVSALRVGTLDEILVPCVCDHSWSMVAAFNDQSCHAQLIEDVPMARKLGEENEVKLEDFEWVCKNLLPFGNLMEDKRFRTAVEALTTYHHHQSFRVMAALLWAGIESLFQINAELRFRISSLIALYLEPRGEKCKDLYRKIKRLYDVRSKAVHGSEVKDADLVDHIKQARSLLSRLLCSITETGKVPSEEDMDNLLFC